MESNIVTVPMFNYRKARAPSQLDSGGCGPCVVVGAIYENNGFMAHYPSEYFAPLEEMVTDLKREVPKISLLRIYITGGGLGSYLIKEERKVVLQNRSQTLQKITEAGFAPNLRQVRWGRGNSTTGLQLLLEERKAIFKEEYDKNQK